VRLRSDQLTADAAAPSCFMRREGWEQTAAKMTPPQIAEASPSGLLPSTSRQNGARPTCATFGGYGWAEKTSA
jgi:hypothetical protein